MAILLDGLGNIMPNSAALTDFTPGASQLPHKKYQVSVYMVKKETALLHWHVHLAMGNQKLQLLKTIQENGGVITYEFAEEVTFSVVSYNVENIKAQMPAMRISVTELGAQATADEATGGPVVISIYFPR